MSGLSVNELKQMAGYKSIDDHVQSGMKVGLGTGSTAAFAVARLGELLASGQLTDIVAVPTSVRTKEQAEGLNIPLCTMDELDGPLDVAIDGADSVELGALSLVKGGGGALLREKLVEVNANKFVVIVDESKLCDKLGKHFPSPVEIMPFAHETTMRSLAALPALAGAGVTAVLRRGSASNNKPDGEDIAVTDNGLYIVDLHCEGDIDEPAELAKQIINTVGVAEHGIFTGMTSVVIVAASEGVRVIEPQA